MITTHQNDSTISVLLATHAINPLSHLFHRELAALIDQLEAQRAQLQAVIVSFHSEVTDHEHELKHLMALTPAQAGDCMQMLGAYNALLRRLECLGIPVIATLSGTVTGHAFGLALACHRRIGAKDATFSLPQVHLGVAPVAGEIARTVRLTGLQAAMPLLLEGATLGAGQALQVGLLHAVTDDSEQATRQAYATALDAAAAVQPWDAKGYCLPGGALNSAAVQTLLQIAPAMLRERTGGHAPAPEAILCAMVEGLQVDLDNALLIESRYFCQTATSQVAHNLMRLSQLKADLASPQAEEFAATLSAALDDEVRALRQDGATEALLRNAARAAGLQPPAAVTAAVAAAAAVAGITAATATPATTTLAPATSAILRQAPDDMPAMEDVRDRLLYCLCVAALGSIQRGVPASSDEADLISVRRCGFPAHTGGAANFVHHVGADAYASRAAKLGPRFTLP